MEIGRPVYSDELLHYQVKGARWGVRRWQNLDGSLTPEGRIHYDKLNRELKKQQKS